MTRPSAPTGEAAVPAGTGLSPTRPNVGSPPAAPSHAAQGGAHTAALSADALIEALASLWEVPLDPRNREYLEDLVLRAFREGSE